MRYLDEHDDLKYFVRTHPKWYRYLGRNPYLVNQLKQETDEFYGRTFTKRMEKMTQRLDMVNMMMQMATMMNKE